jgi:hypothetical protein
MNLFIIDGFLATSKTSNSHGGSVSIEVPRYIIRRDATRINSIRTYTPNVPAYVLTCVEARTLFSLGLPKGTLVRHGGMGGVAPGVPNAAEWRMTFSDDLPLRAVRRCETHHSGVRWASLASLASLFPSPWAPGTLTNTLTEHWCSPKFCRVACAIAVRSLPLFHHPSPTHLASNSIISHLCRLSRRSLTSRLSSSLFVDCRDQPSSFPVNTSFNQSSTPRRSLLVSRLPIGTSFLLGIASSPIRPNPRHFLRVDSSDVSPFTALEVVRKLLLPSLFFDLPTRHQLYG